MIMADLDHFKGVNDTLGHDRGDEALRRYFTLLRDIVSEEGGDAYRRGGDETLAILVGNEPECALRVAEKVRGAVEVEFENFDEKLPEPPTVSIGVATFHGATEPGHALKQVDKLLYQAKGNGRNCVVCESGQSTECTRRGEAV
jgi:diguanylate cyclase (GGDEF)-like protein